MLFSTQITIALTDSLLFRSHLKSFGGHRRPIQILVSTDFFSSLGLNVSRFIRSDAFDVCLDFDYRTRSPKSTAALSIFFQRDCSLSNTISLWHFRFVRGAIDCGVQWIGIE